MSWYLTPGFFYLTWIVAGVGWFMYEKWKERKEVK
jgi:hypothetical protein